MTPYLALLARREVLAAAIRHAMTGNRARLPALYAEARKVTLQAMEMERA